MSFSKGLHKFGIWGNGLGSLDLNTGHKGLGSIVLACDFGESHTAYRNFTGLKSGNYKVSFYIKSDHILKHKHSSLMHRYDAGKGLVTPFYNKYGTFNWTKVEYTTYIKNEFKFWIHLKNAGKVWIDDFSLKKVKTKVHAHTFTKSNYKGFQIVKNKSKKVKAKKPVVLTKKKYSLSKSKYLNLFKDSFTIDTLEGYSRLKLNITNPTIRNYDLYVTLQDKKTTNYWSQLNFVNTIGPGNNTLNFNLNRALGERGSVKYNRKIDLNNITKIFIVIDPNKEGIATDKSFIISKLTLDNFNPPRKDKRILAYDFTSHKLDTLEGFTKVTSQDIYKNSKKFGFVEPEFYRVSDSKYASTINRSYISLLNSGFIVNLPNGEYELELNINGLGYWDVPFWKKREVYLNGEPIYVDSRSSASDYLKDYFRFENIEPTVHDNIYDLYLSKIFKPIRTKVKVTNNFLKFDFKADATGINLNSLIIWPVSANKVARKYLKLLDKFKSKESNLLARKISKKSNSILSKLELSILEPQLNLSVSKISTNKAKEILLKGLSNESTFKIIQLRNNSVAKRISLKLRGKNFADQQFLSFHPLKYQFSALDMNHETYKLLAKIVMPPVQSLNLEANEVRYLLVKIDFSKVKKANQRVTLAFDWKEHYLDLGFKIQKLEYKLPAVDIAAGFLGLETMGPLYYKNKRLDRFKQELRLKALAIIAKYGFTTFSGLPKVNVTNKAGTIQVEDKELKEVLLQAKQLNMSSSIFTYSGEFPNQLISSLKSKADYDFANNYLDKIKVFNGQKIVYTFSDEPNGYSNKLDSDTAKAKDLSKTLPSLLLGGFGAMDKQSKKLNKFFDYGFYSSLDKNELINIDKEDKYWGTYNGSHMPLDDPQFSFGAGLYIMQSIGLNHYLDWHLNATHNYPYFEFDGRETDSVMLYPRSNGDLYTSLKFEHAVLGLNIYRKLILLDKIQGSMSSSARKEYSIVKKYLQKQPSPYRFRSFYHQNSINSNALNDMINNVFYLLSQ